MLCIYSSYDFTQSKMVSSECLLIIIIIMLVSEDQSTLIQTELTIYCIAMFIGWHLNQCLTLNFSYDQSNWISCNWFQHPELYNFYASVLDKFRSCQKGQPLLCLSWDNDIHTFHPLNCIINKCSSISRLPPTNVYDLCTGFIPPWLSACPFS